MRMPKLRELTPEQKDVYLYSPTDRHVLVHGPPGTGKTLIACLRMKEMEARNIPVILGMFNNVLVRYSSNVNGEQSRTTQTVYSWVTAWWQRSDLPPFPDSSTVIVLETKYQDADALRIVTAAGGEYDRRTWRPWGRGYGAYTIGYDQYVQHIDVLQHYRAWHSPPRKPGNPEAIDWQCVYEHVLHNESVIPDAALNLGMVIVDEGQDFPPSFFSFLKLLSFLSRQPGRSVEHPLRCFVLADENQQLTEDNSRLDEIAETLGIAENHRYLLLDNFRNSREVAELARRFFADVSKLPRLPERSTEIPTYSRISNLAEVAAQIRTWVTNNPHKEAGVFVFAEPSRDEIARALASTFANIRGRNVTVQTYSWRSRKENPAKKLVFDSRDVVTVLNMQSCKGLEFDIVFIVHTAGSRAVSHNLDKFKMQMFVAVARARDYVRVLDVSTGDEQSKFCRCLPEAEYLCRNGTGYSAVGAAPSGQSGDNTSGQIAVPQGRSSGKAPPGAAASDWEKAVHEYVQRNPSLKCDDRRNRGGAYWVFGDRGLRPVLEPLGFRFVEKRGGWWRN